MNQPTSRNGDTVWRFEYPPHLAALSHQLETLRQIPTVGGLRPLDIARSACKAEGLELPADESELPRFGDEFAEAIELCTRWPLSAMGQLQWRAVLVTCVRLRLQLERYLMTRGGAVATLRRPLIVVGLPRSGTTFLQYLLSSLPGHQGLPFWQLMRPIPRPYRRWDEQRRKLHGHLASSIFRIAAPEYRRLHLTTAHTLEECWYLFMPSYRVLNADFAMPTPEYGDWLLSTSMRATYERYRMLLQVLQTQVDGRLVLKYPDHLWFLEDLFQVLPEARVLWIHRDPAKTVPSYAAQMALAVRQYMGRADPGLIGSRLFARFQQGLARATDARAHHPTARIVDVHYADLARDPVGTTTTALRALGEEPGSAEKQAMERVLALKRPDGRGRHIYRAKTYGLSESALNEGFADYRRMYGIERE